MRNRDDKQDCNSRNRSCLNRRFCSGGQGDSERLFSKKQGKRNINRGEENMKYLLVTICALLVITGMAIAQDLEVLPKTDGVSIIDQVKKIPGLKQGVGFSLIENEVNYLTTTDLLKWKDYALEAGYNSKDKIILVLSADLINLKKLGVTLPVLDLIDIRVGLYGGWGSINSKALGDSEWDGGISGTAISIKW